MTTVADSKLSRTSLSHVALQTPDVEAAAQFYADAMGLAAEPDRSDARDGRRLGWGSGHDALELLPGAPALDHFGLEIADGGGHHGVGERLERQGVDVRQLDPRAETLLVHDPDGNAVHLHGRVSRAGEHAADPGRRPVRIQHVTLATADLEPMIEFYLTLGFRLTDRMGGVSPGCARTSSTTRWRSSTRAPAVAWITTPSTSLAGMTSRSGLTA